MKILQVGYSAYGGGAGAAARRLNEALCCLGADSRFLYLNPFVRGVTPLSKIENKFNGLQNRVLRMLLGRGRSLNIIPTRILKSINQSDADVVHLHWIHGELLSIAQIAKIKKPVVWTFHDMWPICGTYHCVEEQHFIAGLEGFSGVEGWIYRKKMKHWDDLKVHIVCPSRWMSGCVKESSLFSKHPVITIANALNLETFKPRDKQSARRELGLPLDKKLILSGANSNNSLKGEYLLEEALDCLDAPDCEWVVFGARNMGQKGRIPVHELGMINDEQKLATVYAAADVVCVPSRIESFGLIAAEAMACGIPVVAFDHTGLKDIVDHNENGYLAVPFDVNDLALGLQWVLDKLSSPLYEKICRSARGKIETCFAAEKIACKHIELYEAVMRTQDSGSAAS